MSLSESRVDEAARTLAIESRSLLGLPLESVKTKWFQHLSSPPTPLEFSRIVARHSPLLIDKCIDDRRCSTKWKNSEYLVERMGSRLVDVTLTPDGQADDIHTTGQGTDVFALPHTVKVTFKDLISRLRTDSPVAYLQSQNSNMTEDGAGDLSPLLEDLFLGDGSSHRASSLTWADEALGKTPDATNLWIGTARSRTSMHRDHYENLFTVIRGMKIFTLYPPSEAYYLCDDVPYEVYQWTLENDRDWRLLPTDLPSTPWIPIDPTEPAGSTRNRRHPLYSKALPPLTIEVQEGETLYLPAGWFHQVEQQGDDREGLCICVNWWYESDFAFSDRWALEAFVKEIGQAVRGKH
ncbi:hypothetical protein CBS101457_002717 [Exobasidium rhododendri]|nr:hypothetical protein CBS101457_002717 [Exobasidium rhododendri]